MQTLRTRVLGLIRYLRPDRNPLRRPIDRAHSRLVVAIIALFLVTAALLVTATIRVVGGAGLRAERLQAQTRHRVDAVVVGTASTASGIGRYTTTELRWHDATGHHAGVVAQRKGDRAGVHRTVWVDRSGLVTTHPRSHVQTVTDTTLAAVLGLLVLALLHAGGYSYANRRLDRHRLALWEREWTAIAPRWTGRS